MLENITETERHTREPHPVPIPNIQCKLTDQHKSEGFIRL